MPRERLSPLDSSFLYLDGEVTCNQAVAINYVNGPVDFERMVEELQRKVRYVDRLRQCAVFSPLNLFRPTWEFDPTFDIRNHVHRVVLAPGATDGDVNAEVERIFRKRMDRSRPLWAIHIIEGAPGDRSVYIVVMHHCISDGIGFMRISMVFFDADKTLDLEPWEPSREKAFPGVSARLAIGAVDSIAAIPNVFSDVARMLGTLWSGREARSLLGRFRRAPALRFGFNAPLSGETSYALARFRLNDVHRIRAVHGGTINDIVLTLVGAAVSKYARARSVTINGEFLRCLVPSNARSDETKGRMGNFVSTLPVLVPLGAMPIVERLEAVRNFARAAKEHGLARLMNATIGLPQVLLGAPLACAAHRIYASVWAQRRAHSKGKPSQFNIIVTNVPGSPQPNYVAGSLITEAYILAPLLASIGLVCAALTHNGTLYVSFTGDMATVPDIDALAVYLEEAFAELLPA